MQKLKEKRDPRAATDIDKALGKAIRARRLEQGLSQEDLAAAVGVTFQQIQKYEKGVNRVSTSMLMSIASALETTVGLLCPKVFPHGGDPKVSDFADAHFAHLAAVFAGLNAEGRALLLDLARTLAAQKLFLK